MLKSANEEEKSDGEEYKRKKYRFDRRRERNRCACDMSCDGAYGEGDENCARGGNGNHPGRREKGEPNNRKNDEYVVHGMMRGMGANEAVGKLVEGSREAIVGGHVPPPEVPIIQPGSF